MHLSSIQTHRIQQLVARQEHDITAVTLFYCRRDSWGLFKLCRVQSQKGGWDHGRGATDLLPVVKDDDFAVLVVDGHRALVAFTCRCT